MDLGKPLQTDNSSSKEAEADADAHLVTLDAYPHLDPHTWSRSVRWLRTALASIVLLNGSFSSSGPSQIVPQTVADFNSTPELGTLAISLFIAGYLIGPLIWGPLSERYGRKLVFYAGWIPLLGFQIGCALCTNMPQLLIFRLLSGSFAASALTNSGAYVSDMWSPKERGTAMGIYAWAPFCGPAIAPVVAGAIALTETNWRWLYWILSMFTGLSILVIAFLLPETYVPHLLTIEARRLRKLHNDPGYHSELELKLAGESLKDVVKQTVLKPLIMMVEEPMLLVMSIYQGVVYGVLYLFFPALPIVFQEGRHFNPLETGLVFLAQAVGGTLTIVIYIQYFSVRYVQLVDKFAPRLVPPEARLVPLMYSAAGLVVSLFWFAWTTLPSIHPAASIASLVLAGASMLMMFMATNNYIVDTYLANAASALAASSIIRSAFGAGFPLFARRLYLNLGVPAASSLLGGLMVLFLPAPFVLYKYGDVVRAKSKNAQTDSD